MKPLKLEPTWHNKRGGPQAISKILDRFLIKDSLMNENLIIKSVVETEGCSDHGPISLLISTPEKKPPTPFKFNPHCLEDDQYREQISATWQSVKRSSNCSMMQQFAENLTRARKITKEWNKVHKAQMQKDLKETEEKIEALFHGNEEEVFSEDENLQMKDLEKKKEKLLAIEEKELRLKSRAIWLEAGDKNSKFFHNYDSHKRNINTLCEIKNQEGRLV